MDSPEESRKPLRNTPGLIWKLPGTEERSSALEALDDLIEMLRRERYNPQAPENLGVRLKGQEPLILSEGDQYELVIEFNDADPEEKTYGFITVEYLRDSLSNPILEDHVGMYYFKLEFNIDQLGAKLMHGRGDLDEWRETHVGPEEPASMYERNQFLPQEQQ